MGRIHVAVVGCGHGEIDKIYEVVAKIEEQRKIIVSLVICCGDFQSVRNMTDLRCMACPIKYQQMHDFHRYYSGEKVAPKLTIFIGGNHEASNFLQELPYGGWVAPKIFYMGNAGVFKFGTIRIAGISGIYKGQDYLKGRFEVPPYDQSTMRSVYHYRNIDIFRLTQISKPVDIVVSHDWPKGIHNFGNVNQLLKRKPFFREDIESNELGSRPLFQVLESLTPTYWFSAHMHVKFPAVVDHNIQEGERTQNEPVTNNFSDVIVSSNRTKFLALDKVLPGRQFLQIIEMDNPSEIPELEYDLEWLTILRLTNQLMSVKRTSNFMPGPGGDSRWNFTPTPGEKSEVLGIFENNLKVPENFLPTSYCFSEDDNPKAAQPISNPQTNEFCTKLGISDPLDLIESESYKKTVVGENMSGDLKQPLNYESDVHFQQAITMNTTSFDYDSTNPDEISLDADEVDDSPTSQLPIKRKLKLPSPKRTTEPADSSFGEDLELLKSVMGDSLASHDDPPFFIDTSGDDPAKKRKT